MRMVATGAETVVERPLDDWPPVPPALPGEPEAVFIVGASRSGTTLMRTIIERSPRIAIARENHFVGHLRESEGARFYFRRVGDMRDDAVVRKVVDLIYTGEFQRRSRWREVSPFWRWLVGNVAAADMTARLLATDRTERAVWAAFLRVYADKQGRPIMGEKTPAHLAYVETLLSWFPDGRVVHMIRDPRGVFVSDLRRRRGKLRKPYSWIARVPGLLSATILIQTTWVWRGAARRDPGYAGKYPDRYRRVRFEDVVRSPDETLGSLFAFLGVELPADPTNVKVMARGFNRGEEGLDAGAADRWRSQIGRVSNAWLKFWLRGDLKRLGYTD
jgi:hypothetical protein